jgi:hypothetical protein
MQMRLLLLSLNFIQNIYSSQISNYYSKKSDF